MGDDGVLPDAPVPRGRTPGPLVRTVQPAAVRGHQVPVALLHRQGVPEGLPGPGEQPADAPVQPVGLLGPGHGDPDDDDLGDPLRVPLGVGEDQGRAPGAAVQQPPVDPEVLAQALHVGDQVLGGVVLQARRRIGRVRPAPAAAALVEQDHPVPLRVEQPAAPGVAPGAGAAVHDQGGLAPGVAAGLPVHQVAVAGLQHALRVRLDGRVGLDHDGGPPGRRWRVTRRGYPRTGRPRVARRQPLPGHAAEAHARDTRARHGASVPARPVAVLAG